MTEQKLHQIDHREPDAGAPTAAAAAPTRNIEPDFNPESPQVMRIHIGDDIPHADAWYPGGFEERIYDLQVDDLLELRDACERLLEHAAYYNAELRDDARLHPFRHFMPRNCYLCGGSGEHITPHPAHEYGEVHLCPACTGDPFVQVRPDKSIQCKR